MHDAYQRHVSQKHNVGAATTYTLCSIFRVLCEPWKHQASRPGHLTYFNSVNFCSKQRLVSSSPMLSAWQAGWLLASSLETLEHKRALPLRCRPFFSVTSMSLATCEGQLQVLPTPELHQYACLDSEEDVTCSRVPSPKTLQLAGLRACCSARTAQPIEATAHAIHRSVCVQMVGS